MRRRAAILVVFGLTAVLAACRHDGRDLRGPNGFSQSILPTTTVDPILGDNPGDITGDDGDSGDDGTLAGQDLEKSFGMTMTAPFADGTVIQDRYTCQGDDISPELTWSNLPEGTVEVAIEVTDLQADDYTHWVIAGLDPLTEGIAAGEVPVGAIQATNSAGTVGYTGPCPPAGETHTYLYVVSALGQQTELPDGVDADTLRQAIAGATIESTSVSGTVTG